MESPVAAIQNNNAGEFVTDIESNFDITSSVNKQKIENKPKTDHVETDKPTSGVSKSKYRVGQVVNDQDTDDTKTQAKLQTKAPSGDPEPEKEGTLKKRLKEPRTSLAGIENFGKEKSKFEESGLQSARSDKDVKANLSVIAHNKKSNQNTSQVSWPVESTGQGTYEVYEKLMESKGIPQSAQEIEAENKLLRQFLKDLNEQLKHHVERAKITNYEGKKTEFRDKNAEEQIKTIIRELANNEKILAYNKEEHRKAETRLNAIKDPSYVFNIQKEIMSIQLSIDALKKENKKLGLTTGNVGKNLDVIENVKGMPVSLEETHEREKESIKFLQKLEALKQKNAACLEEKKRKLEKEQTMSEKIQKLEKSYFGDSYISEDTRKKLEKISKHAAAAEEDLKIAQNRCKFKVTQAMRDLEELYVQNSKEREHVERLDDVLREQANALKELISTEGSRLNKGAQEVLDQIKSSLENEEKQKKMSALEEVKSGRDKERSAALLKNKSIDRMNNIQPENPHLNYSTSGKHKNAIRRELEGKKPAWREANNGERARMEENLGISPLKMKKIEESNQFSKPKPVKAPKEPETQEDVLEAQKVEKIKPEEKKPKEITPKASEPQTTLQYNISPKVSKLHEKEESNKEEQNVTKKEKKTKKKVVDDLDNDDLGKLKEEIADYSSQIEKEVGHNDKTTGSDKRKKKSQVEGEFGNVKLSTDIHKEEETEKVFDLGAKKKEKDQTNLKLDLNQPVKGSHDEKNEDLALKSKREGASKRKENGDTDTKRKKDIESPLKSKEVSLVDLDGVKELEDKQDKNRRKSKSDVEDIPKLKIKENNQQLSQIDQPIKSSHANKDEESQAKSKREGESKRKENEVTDTKRTKNLENPQKNKESSQADKEEKEEVREWDDNDFFDDKNKRKQKNQVKDVPKKENKAEDDPDFEELNFDD